MKYISFQAFQRTNPFRIRCLETMKRLFYVIVVVSMADKSAAITYSDTSISGIAAAGESGQFATSIYFESSTKPSFSVNGPSWISISNTSLNWWSNSGGVSFTFKCSANPGLSSRTGTITISYWNPSLSSNRGSKSISVSQNCGSLTVTPTTVSLDGHSQEETIQVNTQSYIKWTAQSNDSWIGVSRESGQGSGTILLSVELNSTDSPRSGTVVVSGMTISVFQSSLRSHSITYENLMGANHSNPDSYFEGDSVVFSPPSNVYGYLFAGWIPAGITASETSDVVATATWTNLVVSSPVVNPTDGFVFTTNSREVSITCATIDASIYFTTNGTTPKTTANYLYTAPITIHETTTIKAVAVKEGVKSEYTTATITKIDPVALPPPTISPEDGTEFFEDSCLVSFSSLVEGVSIFYTTNGTTPKTTSSYLYTGPFSISATTTIKAVAAKEGWLNSDYVTAVISRIALTLELALDLPTKVMVSTGGDAEWFPVCDASAIIGPATAKSGLKHNDNNCQSWLQVSVVGSGILSFWMRTSCEHDEDNAFTWDRLEVYTNGSEIIEMRMDGITPWTQYTIHFSNDSENHVRWTYIKDASEFIGDDCAYVDGITWRPQLIDIDGVIIPSSWIDDHAKPFLDNSNDDYEIAARAPAANGVNNVWECYVAGLSPTNMTEQFLAKINMTNGSAHVWWTPDLNEGGTRNERIYTVEGKTNLVDWSWGPTNESTRFFRVKVEMP